MEYVLSVIIFIVLFIVVGMFMNKDSANSTTNIVDKNNAERAFEYDSGYGGLGAILKVKHRNPIAKTVLKVEANHNVGVTHVPDKVVYTGATVGGVHTGGFHVEKGGDFATLGDKTGTYRITYKFAQTWGDKFVSGNVHYLELPNGLYNVASKNIRMKRYIVTDEHKTHLWNTFNNLKGINNLLSLIDMSKADAEYVVSWLAGEIQ